MTLIPEPCILCGHRSPSEPAHWPIARGSHTKAEIEKLPVIPLCHACHMRQHSGDTITIERLIINAPLYWQRQGTWEKYRDVFDKWMSKREYREAVRCPTP